MPVNQKKHDAFWNLTYTAYEPEHEKLRETLCTIGNGYFGTRGAFECSRSSAAHYPGTYIAGLYNKLPSTVHERLVYNTDLVNCPNWLSTELAFEKDHYVDPVGMKILAYEENLNMRDGILTRMLEACDEKGRITRIESQRFACMATPHFAAMRFTIIPINWDGEMVLRTGIDGTVINDGVPRYRGLASKHLETVGLGEIDNGIFLHVKTNRSHVHIAMCASIRLFENGTRHAADFSTERVTDGFVARKIRFVVEKQSAYTIEKLVSIATSRDANTASAFDAARARLSLAGSFNHLCAQHKREWHRIWDKADIIITGDTFSQTTIRLYIYHLFSTASIHNDAIDTGMPARGLHGEAYRGHVFWDSIFALPFFFQRTPQVACATLMYRYRRLNAARIYAKEHGYKGAMFPWQSAEDGQEETQVIHFNPVSGKWDPDFSSLQRHVSIAIFYNIREYYNYTEDTQFMECYGAEMLIEIARFWASIARREPHDGRYHIRGVMGPDEFHEKYPDRETPGVDDNAYTNVMVVWILEKAVAIIRVLTAETILRLTTKINFNPNEMERWQEITRLMYVPITPDGIICQFDGYMDLRELDLDLYRASFGDIRRMDRILKAQDDSPDCYKVSKQADVLMLFYVLNPDTVMRILKQLGYKTGSRQELVRRNYEYYERRTTHGSTLSAVVHAVVAHELGSQKYAWQWFQEALASDIYDTQGGTTVEGIHSGVMAGTVRLITRVFAGVEYVNGKISIRPSLPSQWTKLQFKLLIRKRWYTFKITTRKVSVGIDTESASPVSLHVHK